MDEAQGKLFGCCCCTAIVVSAVLLFFSFGSLNAYEYGLDYSRITKYLGKQPYSSGYHMLGIGHTFIVYPSTM